MTDPQKDSPFFLIGCYDGKHREKVSYVKDPRTGVCNNQDQITADGGWRMEKCGLKNRVLKKPYFKRKNEKDFSLK